MAYLVECAMTISIAPRHLEPVERVGRYIKDAMGQEQIVFLAPLHWRYLDWLTERGADVQGYIEECDLNRKDVPLSDALSWYVYWWYLDREKAGLARPDWLPEPEIWAFDAD